MQNKISPTSLLSLEARHYPYQDCCTVALGVEAPSIDEVIPAFFRATPRWLDGLMELRNRLVKLVGLKTGRLGAPVVAPPFQVGQSIGLFRIIALTADEVVFGEDDWHLDFRVSFLVRQTAQGSSLAISTMVRTHNRLGRFYFAVVRPFHRVIAPMMAANTARLLRTAP